MLLTLTTTGTDRAPATDLGYLLHKHPDRMQRFGVSAGSAHVFYPVAEPDECTAALLLEVDDESQPHLDDRGYAAGSLLAVAVSSVFRTAMTGRCPARPELAGTALPLVVRLPTLSCGGDPDLVRRLFEPLGWTVEARPVPLDPAFPEWGDSRYVDTTLRGTLRVADALTHLYVLLPACSGAKHYPVGADEVDKLLRVASEWLPAHPERELITRRYLLHRRGHVRSALERLAEVDDVLVTDLDDALAPARVTGGETARTSGPDAAEDAGPAGEPVTDGGDPDGADPDGMSPDRIDADPGGGDRSGTVSDDPATGDMTADRGGTEPPSAGLGAGEETAPSLARQRHAAVLAALRAEGVRRVADLGCGGGALLRELLDDPSFQEILGVDVSTGALEAAARRLRLDRMPDRQRERIALRQSALTYTDAALTGWDGAVLMEVIEHVDPERLPALEQAVFGFARPGVVVVTTPNVEYNVRFDGLCSPHPAGCRPPGPGTFRHADHRFELTRAQFRTWAETVAGRHRYTVRYSGVGVDDAEVGAPTQMAVFRTVGERGVGDT